MSKKIFAAFLLGATLLGSISIMFPEEMREVVHASVVNWECSKCGAHTSNNGHYPTLRACPRGGDHAWVRR